MDIYVPKYIKQTMDYYKKERVTADEYNNILNLLIEASDYNTLIIDAIINDTEVDLVINAEHAKTADEALLAQDSNMLSGATISRYAGTGVLEESDSKIPTSWLVKHSIDKVVEDTNNTFAVHMTRLNNIDELNTIQTNRLNTLDSVNVQYGNRLTQVENRTTANEDDITTVQTVNNNQDKTLASYEQRLINLELHNIPDDVVKTLMSKGGYAHQISDAGGTPVYSENVVREANASTYLLDNGTLRPASYFARADFFTDLAFNSFINRGAIADPSSTYYSVGEMKALLLGAYSVTYEQAAGFNFQIAQNAGVLRTYPSPGGVSLEYEAQSTMTGNRILTCFIPASTPDNYTFGALTWTDLEGEMSGLQSQVSSINIRKVEPQNLEAGADITITKGSGTNDRVFSYTGPKIVISAEQPVADPDRVILWFKDETQVGG